MCPLNRKCIDTREYREHRGYTHVLKVTPVTLLAHYTNRRYHESTAPRNSDEPLFGNGIAVVEFTKMRLH